MKLQRQVNEYFAYMWTCMRGLDETDVMGSLPTSLRRQLAIALNKKLFLKVELFRKCDRLCILALAERLSPSIAVPHEYLIRQGDLVSAIYFVSRGHVLVLERAEETAAATAAATSSRRSEALLIATSTAAAISSAGGGGGGAPPVRMTVSDSPPPSPPGHDGSDNSPTSSAPTTPDLRGRSRRAFGKSGSGSAAASSPQSGGSSRARLSRGMFNSRGARVASAPPELYRVVAQLGEYDTFGEDAFLSRTPSRVSYRATTYCDMMLLSEAAFADVSRHFPQLFEFLDPAQRRKLRKGGSRNVHKLRSVGRAIGAAVLDRNKGLNRCASAAPGEMSASMRKMPRFNLLEGGSKAGLSPELRGTGGGDNGNGGSGDGSPGFRQKLLRNDSLGNVLRRSRAASRDTGLASVADSGMGGGESALAASAEKQRRRSISRDTGLAASASLEAESRSPYRARAGSAVVVEAVGGGGAGGGGGDEQQIGSLFSQDRMAVELDAQAAAAPAPPPRAAAKYAAGSSDDGRDDDDDSKASEDEEVKEEEFGVPRDMQ